MNSPVTHNPKEDAFYERVDPRDSPFVFVEVVFKCDNKVTIHRMKGTREVMAKSKTTIGELFRRLHQNKP